MEKTVEGWDRLNRQVEDIRVLIELGAEAQDEETLAEVGRMNDESRKGSRLPRNSRRCSPAPMTGIPVSFP